VKDSSIAYRQIGHHRILARIPSEIRSIDGVRRNTEARLEEITQGKKEDYFVDRVNRHRAGKNPSIKLQKPMLKEFFPFFPDRLAREQIQIILDRLLKL
jgi:hypothetical protein